MPKRTPWKLDFTFCLCLKSGKCRGSSLHWHHFLWLSLCMCTHHRYLMAVQRLNQFLLRQTDRHLCSWVSWLKDNLWILQKLMLTGGPWDGPWNNTMKWVCHVHRVKQSLHRDPLAGPWMEKPNSGWWGPGWCLCKTWHWSRAGSEQEARKFKGATAWSGATSGRNSKEMLK